MVLVLEYDFVWVVMSCSWLCDEMNMWKEEWANEIRDLKERIICVWWKNEWIEISTTRDWVLIGTRDDVLNRKDWNETIKPRVIWDVSNESISYSERNCLRSTILHFPLPSPPS